LPYEPKVTDFGLAKKLDEPGLTQMGVVMGTPSYMAPEQARGQADVGPLADVYALGALLYECLTGRPPFRGDSVLDVLLLVQQCEPEPPGRVNAAVDRDLETVCLKCLHKEPGLRYASAQALADDLRRYLAGKPIVGRPVGAAERAWKWAGRNRAVAALTAAVALTVVTGAAFSTGFALWARGEAQRAEEGKQKEALLGKDAKKQAHRAQSFARALLLERAVRRPPVVGRGELKVWDVQTGQVRLTLRRHARPDPNVAYTRDGKCIADSAGLTTSSGTRAASSAPQPARTGR
jgi:hypothetical protein